MKRIQAAKRLMGIFLALTMVLGVLPTAALAAGEDGLCPHHTAHDESCGYVAEVPCNHECADECYQTVTSCVQPEGSGESGHVCSVESGCLTKVKKCTHEHAGDCGYVEEVRCNHECKICDLLDLIKKLPEEVTQENRQEVQEQLDAIDRAKEVLEEELEEELRTFNIDFEKYETVKGLIENVNTSREAGTGTETSQGNEAGAGTSQGNEAGAGTSQGNEAGAGTSQGNEAGAGTSQGNEAGAGSAQGSESGAGSTQGNEAGAGSSQGNEAGAGSTQGSEAGAGSTQGNEAGAGSTQGNETGSGSTQGNEAGAETSQGNVAGSGNPQNGVSEGTGNNVSGETENNENQTALVSDPQPSTTLTVQLVGTVTKTYDGTPDVPDDHNLQLNVTGIATGHEVTVMVSYAYNNAEVGTDKTVTANLKLEGVDAGKYTLSSPSVSANVGTITKRPLTITAEDSTLPYGGSLPADGYDVSGLVADHKVTVTLTPSTTNVTQSGSITPKNAVVKAGDTDVTGNYAINYVPGKLVIQADLTAIETLTVENVTSANQTDIEKTQNMLKNADTEGVDAETQKQWEDAAKKCEALLNRIAEVKAENDRITNALKAYKKTTVTSADKKAIEQLVKDIDAQLTSKNLTEGEKNTLTSQKQQANDLLKQIQAAYDAVNTDAIQKTLKISVDKVKREDKADLQQAIADLEKAQKDFGGNYTDTESQKIQAQLKNLKACLESIEKVEQLEADIDKLPKSVEPDDEAAEDALEAMEDYNALSDHEKSMVGSEHKEKVKKLAKEATDYKVIKGASSKWSKSSYTTNLTITANGPYNKFTGLKMDGKTVKTTYYTAKSGSTIVTLKSYYLRSLSDGKHTLTFEYEDGKTECTFYVLAKGASPGTGDSSNITLWVAILGVSAVALAGAFVWKKRNKKDAD